MAAGIATGFVRKLYRILDHESNAIISWDASGTSFSIHDSDKLNDEILPQYFRGRLSAFRQQLIDHGFEQLECEDDEVREVYMHPDFQRGCPGRLSNIVRIPKKSKKKGASQQITATINGSATHNNHNLLAPLTVTLNGNTTKRARPGGEQLGRDPSVALEQKRVRVEPSWPTTAMNNSEINNNSEMGSVMTKNPLFSNDPDMGSLSLARIAETGLLPASTDLPEPISYLTKSSGDDSQQQLPSDSSVSTISSVNGLQASAPVPTASTATSSIMEATMFSDDMVKSALFFLVSSSMTGLENGGSTANTNGNAAAIDAVPTGRDQKNLNTGFLAALLASSSTGAAPNALSEWATSSSASNPLFSDQSTADDDEDQDSIWNLLVASSIDRVKNVISDEISPQEKLKRILAEREKLEEQRLKIGAPAPAIVNITSRPKPPTHPNPLFAASASKTNAFVGTATGTGGNNFSTPSTTRNGPTDDDLWRLLMSSSVDSFRRAAEFEV